MEKPVIPCLSSMKRRCRRSGQLVQDVGQQISEMGQCMQLSPRGMYGMIINKFSELLTEKFIAFRFGFRCDGVGVECHVSKLRNCRLYVGFMDENTQNPGIR